MTVIGRYKYEVNEVNEVFMWDLENPNEEDKPFFFQPHHPDGVKWENKEAAELWASEFIFNLLNPPVVEEEVPIVE